MINLYIAKLRNIALIMCADCTKQVDKSYLLRIHSDISAERYNLLTASIDDGEVDILIKKNFGESANVKNFQSITYLSRYYELTYD